MTLQYFSRKPFSVGEGGDITNYYFTKPLKISIIKKKKLNLILQKK